MRPSHVFLSAVAAFALAACAQNSQQASDTSGAAGNASASSAASTQGSTGLRMYLPNSGITSRHVADQFNFNDVATESRGKPVPLVVLGDPMGADRQALGQAIAQDLHGSNWAGSGITFVPTTGAALSQSRAIDDRSISPFSLVMMINGPNDVTAQAMCNNPAIDSRVASAPGATPPRSGTSGASGTAPESGAAMGASAANSSPVTVISALCRYDKEVSDVSGKTNVTGVTDPAFRGLVNATLAEMAGPQSTNANDTLQGDK
ncbi:MAG TPA: hypothetical protein VL966_02735 [Alphaproteobacteria bacterium]|jgi:hypothetical protein|nr:hypothetical protein [Alphaproteobacteria bacterium]